MSTARGSRRSAGDRPIHRAGGGACVACRCIAVPTAILCLLVAGCRAASVHAWHVDPDGPDWAAERTGRDAWTWSRDGIEIRLHVAAHDPLVELWFDVENRTAEA